MNIFFYFFLFILNNIFYLYFNSKIFFFFNMVYPFFCGFIIFFIPFYYVKIFGFVNSILILYNITLMFYNFDFYNYSFQFYINYQLINNFNFNYTIGVDTLSIIFIWLTAFLFVLCFLSCWFNNFIFIKKKQQLFSLFFLTEFFIFQVFINLDLIFFYFFFESIIFPMFLIILFWGNRIQKIYAAYLFFYYTLIGSIFMLISIIYIYSIIGSTNYIILNNYNFTNFEQLIIFITFFIAFISKLPIYPFHLWLPEAHVEAPTAGSVILAGILLKIGGYGLIRWTLPFFPFAISYCINFINMLCLISIIYSSFCALQQLDIKRIIAYSSISHMSFVTIGIFSNNIEGLTGAIFSMFTHGLISAGLFFCIGVLYDRYATRSILYYGGLSVFMPIFDSIFFILCLSNIAFPSTAGFSSEFILILGIYNKFPIFLIFLFIGIFFTGVYTIWMYVRIMLGPINTFYIKNISDISIREFYIFFILVFFIFYFGLFSFFFTYNVSCWVLNFLI